VPRIARRIATRTRKTIVGTRTRGRRLEPAVAWVMTAATVSTAAVDDERFGSEDPRRTIRAAVNRRSLHRSTRAGHHRAVPDLWRHP
jgi:hypothetical protein